MADNSNSLSWFAYVKYKNDDKEIVAVKNIRERVGGSSKGSPYLPSKLTDFNDKGWNYIVHTTYKSKDNKAHPYYAVIGRLSESKEALENEIANKRVCWPNLEKGNSEPGTESEGEAPDSRGWVSEARNVAASSKRNREAAKEEMGLQILQGKSSQLTKKDVNQLAPVSHESDSEVAVLKKMLEETRRERDETRRERDEYAKSSLSISVLSSELGELRKAMADQQEAIKRLMEEQAKKYSDAIEKLESSIHGSRRKCPDSNFNHVQEWLRKSVPFYRDALDNRHCAW